jgi:CheY-like chemotaxis protein
MGQVNVLIADIQNTCAFFLKSVLSRDGYGISISMDEEEALAKIGTGLFDIVICDLDFSSDKSFEFISEVNDLVPGLPVIIATDWALKYPLRGLDVFAVMDKPLRIAKIREVMVRARQAVTALEDLRRSARKPVDLPAEVITRGKRVLCRATNLSSGGVQLQALPPNGRVRKMLGLTPLLKKSRGESVKTRIFFGKNRVEEFPTRLAYVERFRFASPEQVGLSFTRVTRRQQEAIENYLTTRS